MRHVLTHRCANFGVVAVCVLSTVLSSCSAQNSEGAAAEDSEISSENLRFNATEFRNLSARVDDLESSLKIQQWINDLEKQAFLQPTEQSYSQIRTNIGYVAVSIEDVSSYTNGSKVLINFGNPTGATLIDVSVKFEYGSMTEDGLPDDRVFTKDQKLDVNLPASGWITVPVMFADVPPSELGYIRVTSVEYQSISMRQIP